MIDFYLEYRRKKLQGDSFLLTCIQAIAFMLLCFAFFYALVGAITRDGEIQETKVKAHLAEWGDEVKPVSHE